MTDTVDTAVLLNGKRKYIIRLTNICDGTGESGVVKADISTLLDANGVVPTSFAIESIQWAIQGFTSVRLLFDATTDDEAAILTGNGYREYDPPLKDPRSTGFTGDLLLTTAGDASGNTYDILIVLIKN